MTPLLGAGLLLTILWWAIFHRFAGPAGRATLRKALGQMLEMLLYGDSPRLLGRVLLDLVLTNLRLGLQLLAPSLACLGCLGLVCWGVRAYCEWRPVRVGESFLVSLAGPSSSGLLISSGLRQDSLPLPGRQERFWRLVATREGPQLLELSDHSDRALISVGEGWTWLRPRQSGFTIFYPRRQLWWGDHLLGWPTGLAVACVFWLLIATVAKCCWWAVLRQDGLFPSRKI